MRENLRKRIIIGLLGLLVVPFATAQYSILNDYISTQWSTAGGLPANSVTDVIQTHDGYIYIGTYEGLVRFNGFDFVVMNRHSSSDYNFVSARTLFQDGEGNLWVGSNGEGVQKISPEGNVSFTEADGIPNNSIRAFAQDKEGNLWVGTASGVCYITSDHQIRYPQVEDSVDLTNSLVEELYCDTAGRIWLSTTDSQSLYFYADNKFQRYTGLDHLGSYFVTSISQDVFGVFWLGLGRKGLVRIANGLVEQVTTDTLIDNTPLYQVCHDRSGAIWFGTERGLVLFREGMWVEYAEHSNSVNKIIQDREGNIWVATDSKGLTKISTGRFSTHILNTAVNAIAQGHDGLVWVGTDSGLLCYQQDMPVENKLTRYCQNLRIRHLEIADNGEVMVSAYTAPAHISYNPANGIIRSWSTADGLAGDKTRVSLQLDNGDIYVGTTTGLSIIRPDGSIHSFQKSDGLDNEYIMCLYQDRQGIVWIGTDGGGIYLMKDEVIVDKISTTEGLAGNVIFKIMQDGSGVYWICTGTGVSRYQSVPGVEETAGLQRSFFNFDSNNGLGTDSLFQMILDHNSTVWMVSNRGISSVPLAELNDVADGRSNRSRVDAKFYNQNDGLRSDGANSTALSMRDSTGRIWFTMVDGFVVYDPLKNQAGGVQPLVHIESIVLDNKPLSARSSKFVLPAGAKRLQIDYSGLSFVSPERVRFKHMLAGFDTDYCQPTQNRTVSYTNLKPGNYRLLITAMNAAGMWNTSPTVIEFTQEAFFWQRPLFWAIFSLALLILILLIFYWREGINRRRQRLLEEMVQLRTHDLRLEQQKSDGLLRNILPDAIADRLKANEKGTIAEYFPEATILFADIVGFTQLSSQESAEKVVSALNQLFSRFDERAVEMGVEKIKTIGDAYMAACGIPTPNPDHALVMLKFAKVMYQELAEFNKTSSIPLSLRIGMNSGPVVAGVIGKRKFIYDVWGDTVNTASRMEPLCTPGRIRITESVQRIINECTKGAVAMREEDCNVKGKGIMHTFEI